MTDAELLDLYRRRNACLKALGGPHQSGVSLGAMSAAQRGLADRLSREFRAADAAIVGELVARGSPARLSDVALWLTSDGLNFVEVDPTSGDLVYIDPKQGGTARSLLYRYPTDARVRGKRGTGAAAR